MPFFSVEWIIVKSNEFLCESVNENWPISQCHKRNQKYFPKSSNTLIYLTTRSIVAETKKIVI